MNLEKQTGPHGTPYTQLVGLSHVTVSPRPSWYLKNMNTASSKHFHKSPM
jgi:hypothetical protein